MLLQEKLRQAVLLVNIRYKGGIILPNETDANTGKPVEDASNHPNPTFTDFEAFNPYTSTTALIDLDITSNIVEQVDNTMQGKYVLGGIGESACKYWMNHYGTSSQDLW